MFLKRLVVFALCTMMILGSFPSTALAEAADGEIPPDSAPQDSAQIILVENILISSEEVKTTVSAGKTLRLRAEVSPSDATEREVAWTSSNEQIATVSASGVLTALAEGFVTIKASALDDSGVFGEIGLSVLPKAAEPVVSGDMKITFSKYHTLDASGDAHYIQECQAGDEINLTPAFESSDTVTYKWQMLGKTTTEYIDIPLEENPTSLDKQLLFTIGEDMLGEEDLLRCELTAQRGEQTLTQYAYFTFLQLVPVKLDALPQNAPEPDMETSSLQYRENGYTYTVQDGKATIVYYEGTGTTLNIPTTLGSYPVTAIGMSSFQCDYKSVVIPEGILSVGQSAFDSSTIDSISIPSTVTEVGDRAFGAIYLKSISVATASETFRAVDGILFSSNLDTLVCYPMSKSGATYQIPDSVKHIGNYAFIRASNITQITFGADSALETIGEYGFGRVQNLNMSTLSFPASLRAIGAHAFESNTTLTRVFINGPLDSIGAYCFADCSNLFAFYSYGNAPSSCGSYAFRGTSSDFKIYYVSGKAGWQTPSWNGYPCSLHTPVVSVSIDSSDSVHVCDRIPLTATIAPSNASIQTLLWSLQSGTGSAKIEDGYLYGLTAGTVTLSCLISDVSGDVVDSKTITILPQQSNPLISEIILSAPDNYVIAGSTLQISKVIYPTNATGAIEWSVIPGTGSATISSSGVLTGVSNGTVTVRASASDGSGKKVEIVISVIAEVTIDLSALNSGLPASTYGYSISSDGTITLGKGISKFTIKGTSNQFSILASTNSNINLVLQDLSMNLLGKGRLSPIRIPDGVTANVTILGTVTLQSSEGAGIEVAKGAKALINSSSTGTLSTPSTPTSIGGIPYQDCGNIQIDGGTINGTHIGAGYYTSGADIQINGGVLDVRSIGAQYLGSGGTITIQGGSVTAAHIGGGGMSAGGTIRISGGIVNVTSTSSVAAIGGGDGGAGGKITITGGTIHATSTATGAAIGGGRNGSGGTVVIDGGNVYAEGPSGAMDIGSGAGGITPGTIKNSAGSDVYLVGLNYGSANAAPSTMQLGGNAENYGTNDYRSHANGYLYFYLPVGTASAIIDGTNYEAEIAADQYNLFLLATYSISLNLDRLVSSNTSVAIDRRETYSTTLSCVDDSVFLPLQVNVQMGTDTLVVDQSYSYDPDTGELSVPNITADLTITAMADTAFQFTQNLSGLVSDASETRLRAGSDFLVTILPETILQAIPATVSVSMDGRVLAGAEYTYNRYNGEIRIPQITGDVVITANSIAVPDSSSLSALAYSVDGGATEDVVGFASNTLAYEIELPKGTPENGAITLVATPTTSDAVINASDLSILLTNGLADATITVTGSDLTTIVYQLHFYVGAVSIDLSTLVDGIYRGYSVDAFSVTITDAKYVYELTGSSAKNVLISTGDETRVTLSNVTLDLSSKALAALSIASGSTLALTVAENNTLTGAVNRAGIEVPYGAKLRISDESTGSISVYGGKFAAGIGGSYQSSCGEIVIDGGNISAYCGGYGSYIGWTWTPGGAGIGAATGGTIAPVIIINGGTISAHGVGSAGIGAPSWASCGSITINGGDITATAVTSASGIGSGQAATGGNITINGGTIHASCETNGAGIGSIGSSGVIHITGGTIYAQGGEGYVDSYSSGSGIGNDGGTVIITGGWIQATGGEGAAGIGGNTTQTGGHIIIQGGEIYANGGYGSNSGAGAGIGGGGSAECGSIVISGGTIVANGGFSKIGCGAPGIGSGGYGTGLGQGNGDGSVLISGGFVQATGALNAAGIGGGWNADGYPVVITGGTVDARCNLVNSVITSTASASGTSSRLSDDATVSSESSAITDTTVLSIDSDQLETVTASTSKAKNIGNGAGDRALSAGTVKNGSSNVYLAKLYIGKGSTGFDASIMTLGGVAATYRKVGMNVDRDGYLRFYLPVGKAWVKYGTKASAVTVSSSGSNLFSNLAAVPLSSIKLSDSACKLYIGDSKKLSVTLLPEYTTVDPAVAWSSSNPLVASVEDGKITALSGGKTTIKAAIGSISVTCSVEVIVPVERLEILGSTSILGGASIQLGCGAYPQDATKKTVAWSLSEESLAFASITAGGLLTAKNVSEANDILVNATAQDGSGAVAELTIAVVPRAAGITIQNHADDTSVGGKTINLNLNHKDDLGEPVLLYQFDAKVLPADAAQGVTWKSSAPLIASVDTDGVVTLRKAGTAIITATATDGSKLTTSFTVKVVSMPHAIEFVAPQKTLMSGTSAVYKVCNAETKTTLASNTVKWSIAEGASYASIDSAGKLLTRPVPVKTNITISASVLAGYETLSAEAEITLYPAVTQIQILSGENIVTNSTIALDTNGADPAVAPSLALHCALYPDDALQSVSWSSSNSGIATIDASGKVSAVKNASTGTYKTGAVVITCKALDGSGKTAKVNVQVGVMASSVSILPLAEGFVLRCGKSVQLKATIQPNNASFVNAAWQLKSSSDGAYVTLSSSGLLTAKNVFETHIVTLVARSVDPLGKNDELNITIQPKTDDILIIKQGVRNVTSGVVYLDAHQTSPAAELAAYVLGETEPASVQWKSSAPTVASVNYQGKVTLLKVGSALITASFGGKTTSVTIKGAKLASGVTISAKSASSPVTLAYGKSLTLIASILPATTTSKAVMWTIPSEYSAYAKVTSAGVVTAIGGLTVEKTIEVYATTTDGSNLTSASIEITLKPIATALSIKSSDGVINSTTQTLDLSGTAELTLESVIYPLNASQGVRWTSSNASIASIDQTNGKLLALKSGSVTITATATDGSGVSASFKLNVIARITSITLSANYGVAGGKSIAITPTITPSSATNKNLSWSISGDTAFATISATGVLTAKPVTGKKTILVTALALDGSGKSEQCEVTIYPTVTTSVLVKNGEGTNLTGKTATLVLGNTLNLVAFCLPVGSYQNLTWKTSNASLVSLTQSGDGVTATALKLGPATITATASDGSGKTASFILKVAS